MRNVTIKKEATILFNKKLYIKEAIEQAIEDFSEVATIKLYDKDDFVVSLTSTGDMDVIALEFQNYVLGVMKNETMV